MRVKAEEVKARKLFDAGQQLLIPLWQRHFSWDKPQLNELWSDLLRAQERRETTHFLGSIVLKTLPFEGSPSEAQRYWVVDGQQRTTTLVLLMAAMRDRLAHLAKTAEEREKILADYTAQLFCNTNLKEGHQERLVLQEKDATLLAPIVKGTWDGDTASLLEAGYEFFRTKLQAYDAAAVEVLMSVVLVNFEAAWVTLQDGDNAHRVFQTLNAGGKKLKQSDLVRNYFFLLLADKSDSFYQDHWRALERDHPEKQLEEYLVAWAISQGYTGGKDSLFSYFNRDLVKHEHDLESVLGYGREFTGSVKYFDWIRNPEDAAVGKGVKRSLRDLRKWGTLPAEGLLFWLLRAHVDGRLDEPALEQALEVVLSFVARRQLAGFEPNLHKSILVAATLKLRAQNGLSGQDISDYLRLVLSEGVEVRTWPPDELIKARTRSTPIYTEARSAWAFVLLERINRVMFDKPGHAPGPLDRAEYSVEHVMPQKLPGSWVEELKDWGVNDWQRLHTDKLDVLGNLSLTPINSELSNLPFSVKRTKLIDDWLRLNVEIVSSATWTENRIDERSTSMSLKACKAFTSPLVGDELTAARAKYTVEPSGEAEAEQLQVELEEAGG
jgi:hypothetical protein